MATRARIIKVALKLFADLGYKAVTMRKLAEKVDINQATFYHYFHSKEQLYEAVLREAYEERAGQIIDIVHGQESKEERLWRACLEFSSSFNADLAFIKLVKREQLQGDKKRMQLMWDQLFADLVAALKDLLAEFDSGLDVDLIHHFFNGMMLHYYETVAFRQLYEGKKARLPPKVVAEQIYRIMHAALSGQSAITKIPGVD